MQPVRPVCNIGNLLIPICLIAVRHFSTYVYTYTTNYYTSSRLPSTVLTESFHF